jgi:hypothetical protein
LAKARAEDLNKEQAEQQQKRNNGFMSGVSSETMVFSDGGTNSGGDPYTPIDPILSPGFIQLMAPIGYVQTDPQMGPLSDFRISPLLTSKILPDPTAGSPLEMGQPHMRGSMFLDEHRMLPAVPEVLFQPRMMPADAQCFDAVHLTMSTCPQMQQDTAPAEQHYQTIPSDYHQQSLMQDSHLTHHVFSGGQSALSLSEFIRYRAQSTEDISYQPQFQSAQSGAWFNAHEVNDMSSTKPFDSQALPLFQALAPNDPFLSPVPSHRTFDSK